MELMGLGKLIQLGSDYIMLVILAVFAAGIAIALERFIYISRTNRATNKVWAQLVPMLKANDLQRAVKLIEGVNTPLSIIMAYAFSRHSANKKREVIEAAMEEGMMDTMPDLVKRTHYLATFANIATLLGLLGTILGLIMAFDAVSSASPSEKATLLSRSIALAMNTTAAGLIAAIPLLLIHSYLVTKTSRLVDNLEKAAVKSLNMIVRD